MLTQLATYSTTQEKVMDGLQEVSSASRERLPKSEQFDKEDIKRLANRFFALRSKAKAKGIPFAWEKLGQFVKDLEQVFPGRKLDDIRIRFHGGTMLGYSLETLDPSGSAGKPVAERRVGKKVTDANLSGVDLRGVDLRGVDLRGVDLSAEIAVVLMGSSVPEGEMRPIEETVAEAVANVA